MTENEMRAAGQMMDQMSSTDTQLELMIQSTALVLAYLEGRGPEWDLALHPLRLDLERLQNYQNVRKRFSHLCK